MTATRPRSQGIYLIITGLMIVVAQATLISRFRLLNVSPDLVLVTAVYVSLVRGVREGLMWAFGGGLGIDLFAGLPLGASSLALLPVPWLGDMGRFSVFSTHAWLPIVLVALATPLRGWIMLLLQQTRGTQVNWIASTLHVIGPEMLLNVLLAVAIYPIVHWLIGGLNRRAAGI